MDRCPSRLSGRVTGPLDSETGFRVGRAVTERARRIIERSVGKRMLYAWISKKTTLGNVSSIEMSERKIDRWCMEERRFEGDQSTACPERKNKGRKDNCPCGHGCLIYCNGRLQP